MASALLARSTPRLLVRSALPPIATKSLLRPFSTTSFRLATGGVSQQPGSKSFSELTHNAKEEGKDVAKSVAQAITGASEQSSQLGGSSGLEGVKSDLDSMGTLIEKIPDKALLFGAAGLLPYAGTSLTTIYLSQQAGTAVESGENAEVALALLHHVELLQVQYGAIILSFLGAIHWGFEFAGYGGSKGSSRYLLGVAPVLAGWTTLLLPGHLALIGQWASFTAMWWADQRATGLGWTPKWYSTYRFWLTAIVGSSIILTLGGATYLGPGSELTSARGRLQEHAGSQDGKMLSEGGAVTMGDIKVEKSDDAYLKFTNLEKVREAEKKAEEDKKEQAKKDKADAKGKAEKEAKEKEEKLRKKGGA